VRFVVDAEQPSLRSTLQGGLGYLRNPGDGYLYACSIGFNVSQGSTPGYVSAGHCGDAGEPVYLEGSAGTGPQWTIGPKVGTFSASSFPQPGQTGNDWSWIRVDAGNTLSPTVYGWGKGDVTVRGSTEAAIGSSICRSGRTTGWRCGTIQAKNVTVNYAQGAVYGLTQTNACCEGGDSGGAWISGNQAQGVTSGGTGNCSSGGTMWFQPVNEILSVFGLSLTTTGGGGAGQAIISTMNNKCIDVPGANFSDGVLVQMYTCNGTNAQRWNHVNGQLQTSNGKCLDAAGGGTANNTQIQIVGCHDHPAQQFVFSAAGDLVNPVSNRCVDIRDWNAGDGAQLILYDCHGGANQKWRRG